MSDLSSVIADFREARFACIVEKEHIKSDVLDYYRAIGHFNIALCIPTQLQDQEERLHFLETWKTYPGRVLVWIRQDELNVLEAFDLCDQFVYTDEGLLHMDYDEE